LGNGLAERLLDHLYFKQKKVSINVNSMKMVFGIAKKKKKKKKIRQDFTPCAQRPWAAHVVYTPQSDRIAPGSDFPSAPCI
jgi:hypothetical protein